MGNFISNFLTNIHKVVPSVYKMFRPFTRSSVRLRHMFRKCTAGINKASTLLHLNIICHEKTHFQLKIYIPACSGGIRLSQGNLDMFILISFFTKNSPFLKKNFPTQPRKIFHTPPAPLVVKIRTNIQHRWQHWYYPGVYSYGTPWFRTFTLV